MKKSSYNLFDSRYKVDSFINKFLKDGGKNVHRQFVLLFILLEIVKSQYKNQIQNTCQYHANSANFRFYIK